MVSHTTMHVHAAYVQLLIAKRVFAFAFLHSQASENDLQDESIK